MRFFWTLSAVPRPDNSYFALMGVTLVTYLLFRDVPVALFGAPVSAINLALAVFLFVSMSRNLIFNRAMWQRSSGRTAGVIILLALPVVLSAVLGAVSVLTLQLAFTTWLMSYALFILAILKWDPAFIPNLPSIWSRDRFAVPALTLVAIGDATVATTLAAVALWGSELAWILVLTLGAISTKIFVNWIVVLMIVVRLDEED